MLDAKNWHLFFFTSAITYGIYVCIEPYTAQMI